MIEHVVRISLVLALGDLLPPQRCFVEKFFPLKVTYYHQICLQ